MPQRPPLTRWYVHGDRHDEDPTKYFCDRCDAFAPIEHFSDSDHSQTRVSRYQSSLAGWGRLSKDKKQNYYRPQSAENLLADVVAQDVKNENASRSKFFAWLLKQKDRDDPIGDLAGDVSRDPSFPRTSNSLEQLRSRLIHKRAHAEAIVALDEAWSECSPTKKSRSAISPSRRFAIFKRDGYACCLCGSSATDGKKLEIDHRVPVAKGGTNDDANLWTLCFECNRGKSDNDL